MKIIKNLSEISIGDYILYKLEDLNIDRVYKVLEIHSAGISKREFIYSSDKKNHANAFISSSTFRNGLWFLLDQEEANYYLKLMIFSS